MREVAVMCMDKVCPSRDRCHRHAASGTKPGTDQPYANFRRDPEETVCLQWWPKECAPQQGQK